MLRIENVQPLGGFQLALRFSDGTEGTVDLSHIPHTGVFAAWNDPAFFGQVCVNPESGTIEWPGHIDLDPIVLYARARGISIEEALMASEPAYAGA